MCRVLPPRFATAWLRHSADDASLQRRHEGHRGQIRRYQKNGIAERHDATQATAFTIHCRQLPRDDAIAAGVPRRAGRELACH